MNKDLIKLVIVYVVLAFLASSCAKEHGPQGSAGANGSSCSVKQEESGARITCTDGSSAFIADGDQGPQGVSGAPGKDGKDASPVTAVQFCDGASTYPSTFPEIGFCIGGNIYAVYSTHGGFAAYLPPGTYYSNAENSSCTFTVGDNCSITH